MSKVYATMSGFVGHAGQSVWIGEGDEHDDSDPLVKANPDRFTKATSSSAQVADDKTRRRLGGGRG